MARISQIDQFPERKEQLIELLADGKTQKAIGEVFGVDRGTVAEWAKRPEVQAGVTRLIQKRSNEILSLTDSKIAARLRSDKAVPLPDLLQIRRTFAGERLTINSEGSESEAMSELLAKLHEKPELAAALGAAPDDSD